MMPNSVDILQGVSRWESLVVDNEGDKGKLLQFTPHLIPEDGFTLISVSTN